MDLRLAYHRQGGGTLTELAPTLRFACNGAGQGEVNGALGPTGRLALADGQAERNPNGGLGMPDVRLAYNPGPVNAYGALAPTVRLATAEGGMAYPGGAIHSSLQDREYRPALLVSYVYLKPFLANRHRYCYRDWVLDSGAFSAHNSGTQIKLQDYIDTCKRLIDSDATLSEVYALDVIGDWRAGLKNCEEMHRQGVPAIPCYHANEPESVLLGLARDYPKIALGGVALAKAGLKLDWARQCFARVWPKKIHGFGYGSERQILSLPWHSVDATSWEIGPCRFGRWQSFGKMSVRGSKQNLRAEVEWYLRIEQRARQRWAKEMALLNDVPHHQEV